MFFRWRIMSPLVHLHQTQSKKAAGGRWFEYRKTKKCGSKPRLLSPERQLSRAGHKQLFPERQHRSAAGAARSFISQHWALSLQVGLCLLKRFCASHQCWHITRLFLTAESRWSNCINTSAAFCETQAIKSLLSGPSLTTCGIGYRKVKDPNHWPSRMGK